MLEVMFEATEAVGASTELPSRWRGSVRQQLQVEMGASPFRQRALVLLALRHVLLLASDGLHLLVCGVLAATAAAALAGAVVAIRSSGGGHRGLGARIAHMRSQRPSVGAGHEAKIRCQRRYD
jgi:hypothetical protein